MRTTTIFDAWRLAIAYNDTYSIVPERNERQAIRFYHALLARIKAGDRAREALRWVEWFDTTRPDYPGEYCPWCDCDYHEGHAPDCPRQIALGLQEPQP